MRLKKQSLQREGIKSYYFGVCRSMREELHNRAMSRSIVLFCFFLFSILIASSAAVDFITASQTIADGKNTIESAGGVFELGFFCPGRSKNRYLGIWYKKISTGTVVWVANRETPLTDTSGVLRIDSMGTLVLLNATDSIIWSSSSNSSISVTNPVVQLLDTGNLVIRDESDGYSENYLWQSFDHPGDTLLPGMKLGWDLVKSLDSYITSWKSSYDPSPGNYTSGIDPNGYPQLLLWKGSAVQFRLGPWDGIQFSGMYYYMSKQIYTANFAYNQKEIYYKYELINSSTFMRILLDPNGNIQLLTWIDRTQSWQSFRAAQRDDCDHYAFCGPYSTCNGVNSQLLKADACGCLKGFEPKFSEKKKLTDWSDGCVRKTQLDCKSGEGFLRYSGLKLPDTRHSWFDPNMNIEECESACLKNCSCTAYAIMDFNGGRNGCMLWLNDLIDIRDCREDGKVLYVRMAASEFESNRTSRSKTKGRTIVIAALVALAVLTGLLLLHIFKKRKLKRKLRRKGILLVNLESDDTNQSETEDLLQLPLFDFRTIAHATNNFSEKNKLGEGGFGPVYKGILDDGQEIAVKRLSKTSQQGQDEFKNEVSCISKLQHRNLVRLLGCCIEEGEMLLIYEYMPNKSLDSFIFDDKLGELLDWSKRYNIINGIARGLLYLHQDSRLRIIHRDLKASNILLDCEMNPRISDFGIARSFRGSETEVNTSRVVGTYGYMSPEYALDGIYSFKSDVYSFGVLVLEIVSGTKMRGFYNSDPGLNLLGHAWSLYNDGKFLELIDARISESCNQFEVFRAIEIGLLCVQSHPNDRPSMSSVVSMLSSDTALPQPKQPGFFIEMKQHESGSSPSKSELFLSNNLTVTFYAPR